MTLQRYIRIFNPRQVGGVTPSGRRKPIHGGSEAASMPLNARESNTPHLPLAILGSTGGPSTTSG